MVNKIIKKIGFDFNNSSYLSFNRLSELPRSFGSFQKLEILDLSYNNLTEKSLPNNFFELSKIIFIFKLKNIKISLFLRDIKSFIFILQFI